MPSPNKTRTVKLKAFGILNAFGTPWTTRTFQTEAGAEQYKDTFWDDVTQPPEMSGFRVVPVVVVFKLPTRKV